MSVIEAKGEVKKDAPKGRSGVLVWMDMEMTGLNPEVDVPIEIATIITDNDLNVVAEGPDLVIHQDASLFQKMDKWNQDHHSKSGLWAAVLASTISLDEAERLTLEFIKKHVGPRESPLCGNSIWQDRRFLRRYMPSIEGHLHYRLIDVSTIKELVNRWYPDAFRYRDKTMAHRALDDVRESIDELRYYRRMIFKNQAQEDPKLK